MYQRDSVFMALLFPPDRQKTSGWHFVQNMAQEKQVT
jgi:hypothetical protein